MRLAIAPELIEAARDPEGRGMEISRLRSTDAFRVWVYRIVAREALRVAKRCVPAE